MADVLSLFEDLPLTRFDTGAVLITENENAGRIYILASGTVEICKENVRLSAIREPGAVLGEMSVLLGAPNTATVRTLEPSSFYVVENPMAFMESHPQAMIHISRILARRLRSLTNYLVDIKKQFGDQGSHLGMIDEVLDSLLHHHPRK